MTNRRTWGAEDFFVLYFLQPAKFRTVEKFASCTHCSPFFHYSPFLLFDTVTFLLQFFVSSHFIPCNSFWFWFFFCDFPCSEQYISLSQALYKGITSCNKFLAGSFQRSYLFFFCFTFSHFLSIFWAAKHPPRMTTQRMNG